MRICIKPASGAYRPTRLSAVPSGKNRSVPPTAPVGGTRHTGSLYRWLALLLVLALTLPASAFTVQAQGPQSDMVRAGLEYLQAELTPEGGLDPFGSGPDPSTSLRALLALGTLGLPANALTHPDTGATLLSFLQDSAWEYTHAPEGLSASELFPGSAGLVLAALSAVGIDTRLPEELLSSVDPDADSLIAQLESTLDVDGGYRTAAEEGYSTGEPLPPNQAFAILGLAMAGRAVPQDAVDYLISLQGEDGSWADGDLDTTALALVALMATGRVSAYDAPVVSALAFLQESQLEGGGWRPGWDTEALNADTTAWVIQALLACGIDPESGAWVRAASPVQALASLQQEDGRVGGEYASSYSTAEALMGLSGRALFLTPALQSQRALSWMAESSMTPGLQPGAAIDISLAMLAAGYDPASAPAADGTLADVIEAAAAEYAAGSVDQAGKLALYAGLAGSSPDQPELDLSESILGQFDPEVGAFGVVTNTYQQAYALLGLAALDTALPEGAVDALRELQQPDGGWKYDLTESDWNTTTPDNTGLALQALSAAGVPADDPAMVAGLGYLQATQLPSGDWGNANSTALALQALYALDQDLADWKAEDGSTPIRALAAFGKVDGPFTWMWDSPWGGPEDNLLATAQSIPALLGVPMLSKTATVWTPFVSVSRGDDPDRSRVTQPALEVSAEGATQLRLQHFGDLDGDAVARVEVLRSGNVWESVEPIMEGNELVYPLGTGAMRLVRSLFYDPDGLDTSSGTQSHLAMLALLPSWAEDPASAPPLVGTLLPPHTWWR
ncbi:MAG: hypothetical protein ACOX2L_01975 [Anaerolineae bacterium]|jgi:hypothetical protein|nr:hypothetical protein [Chloroflexota bacterium]